MQDDSKHKGHNPASENKDLTPPNPENAAAGVKRNDYPTFEQIHARWKDPLRSFVAKHIELAAYAEDIVQDVFLDLWKMRDSLDYSRDPKALMFTIARNKAADLYQNRKQANNYLKTTDYDEVDPNDSHEILVVKETRLELGFILEQMPKNRQKIFLMSVKDGLSAGEIARRMNFTKESVYVHLSAARKQIRESLSLLFLFFYI